MIKPLSEEKNIVLVVDNARIHHSKKLKEITQ